MAPFFNTLFIRFEYATLLLVPCTSAFACDLLIHYAFSHSFGVLNSVSYCSKVVCARYGFLTPRFQAKMTMFLSSYSSDILLVVCELPLPLSPAWTIFLSSTFYSSYFILLTFHLVVFFTLTLPLLSGTFYSQVKQNIFFLVPSFPSVSYHKYYHTVYEVFYFCAEHMPSIQSPFSFFVGTRYQSSEITFVQSKAFPSDAPTMDLIRFELFKCAPSMHYEVILFTYMFVCVCVRVKMFRRFHM